MENVNLFFGIIKWFFFAIVILKIISFDTENTNRCCTVRAKGGKVL